MFQVCQLISTFQMICTYMRLCNSLQREPLELYFDANLKRHQTLSLTQYIIWEWGRRNVLCLSLVLYIRSMKYPVIYYRMYNPKTYNIISIFFGLDDMWWTYRNCLKTIFTWTKNRFNYVISTDPDLLASVGKKKRDKYSKLCFTE